MLLRLLLVSLVATAAVGAATLSAEASSIGPACGTCQGSIYTITYDPTPIATTPTTEVWEVTYAIDTSGYAGGGQYLDTVSIKVSSALASADLVSAPGGIANWIETLGGLNANGCSGSGSGFDCAEAVAVDPSIAVPGGTYVWVFHLEVASGGLFLGTGASSVKARYVDADRDKVGALVSEGITLTAIPEPGTAAFVLLGLLGIGARRQRV